MEVAMIHRRHRVNFRLLDSEFERFAGLLGKNGCWTWTDMCRKALKDYWEKMGRPEAPAKKEVNVLTSKSPDLLSDIRTRRQTSARENGRKKPARRN
jgi:hypothetical protein